MKTWKQTIDPLLKKFKAQTDKIFQQYNKEVKEKNITATSEMNKLWNSKYKEKLEAIEKKHDEEYKKVWYKFHKK
jgi:Spy/CpxP family protein refolding chaperone